MSRAVEVRKNDEHDPVLIALSRSFNRTVKAVATGKDGYFDSYKEAKVLQSLIKERKTECEQQSTSIVRFLSNEAYFLPDREPLGYQESLDQALINTLDRVMRTDSAVFAYDLLKSIDCIRKLIELGAEKPGGYQFNINQMLKTAVINKDSRYSMNDISSFLDVTEALLGIGAKATCSLKEGYTVIALEEFKKSNFYNYSRCLKIGAEHKLPNLDIIQQAFETPGAYSISLWGAVRFLETFISEAPSLEEVGVFIKRMIDFLCDHHRYKGIAEDIKSILRENTELEEIIKSYMLEKALPVINDLMEELNCALGCKIPVLLAKVKYLKIIGLPITGGIQDSLDKSLIQAIENYHCGFALEILKLGANCDVRTLHKNSVLYINELHECLQRNVKSDLSIMNRRLAQLKVVMTFISATSPDALTSISYKKILEAVERSGGITEAKIEELPLLPSLKEHLKTLSHNKDYETSLLTRTPELQTLMSDILTIAYENDEIDEDASDWKTLQKRLVSIGVIGNRASQKTLNKALEGYLALDDLDGVSQLFKLGVKPEPGLRARLNSLVLSKIEECISEKSGCCTFRIQKKLFNLSELTPGQQAIANDLFRSAVRNDLLYIAHYLLASGTKKDAESNSLINEQLKEHLVNFTSVERVKQLYSLGGRLMENDPDLCTGMVAVMEENRPMTSFDAGYNGKPMEKLQAMYEFGGIKPLQPDLDKGLENALEKNNMRLAKYYHHMGARLVNTQLLNKLFISDMMYKKLTCCNNDRYYPKEDAAFFYQLGATLSEENVKAELRQAILDQDLCRMRVLYDNIGVTRKSPAIGKRRSNRI
ncbi:hypothetical protein [uncultured Endozoicomonas sp.]|uniref:hypothetical protein n=1 Tax=uncultured Endozoicomonas sp. TaxID=432652 RepID=UPI00261B9360|nr:hypothetical protein [uncultured Endozoicomonas sp.]